MMDCFSAMTGFGNGGSFTLVVGAGSAGFSAAITAAEEGARVVLIGHGTVGGTCVNVGCVPSKAMIRAVETLHAATGAERFDGIEAAGQITDWKALVAQKQALVDDLRAAKYTDVLPSYDSVSYMEGQARFTEDGSLQVGSRTIHAPKVIVATGSSPHVPDIPGLDGIDWLDSTSALEQEQLPKSMMVMGGGYIGVEIAQIFARAGVEVTIVTRRGLLPEAEPEVYMAAYGAKLAAKNAMNGNSLAYDNSVMPAVVFSDPQVASVGLTEAQANAAGHDVVTSVLGLEHVPRALAARDTRGLIKLVADKQSKKLLGAHIIAPEGADSIQTAAMALKMGMTYDDLGAMIFPYLTTVEGLKLAAQTFEKDVAKLSCCAG